MYQHESLVPSARITSIHLSTSNSRTSPALLGIFYLGDGDHRFSVPLPFDQNLVPTAFSCFLLPLSCLSTIRASGIQDHHNLDQHLLAILNDNGTKETHTAVDPSTRIPWSLRVNITTCPTFTPSPGRCPRLVDTTCSALSRRVSTNLTRSVDRIKR